MRFKIQAQQRFVFENQSPVNKAELQYVEKYRKISEVLENCPEILNAVHHDTKSIGSSKSRSCQFSTHTLFRMILLMQIENLSFRGVCLRVYDSHVLRNFVNLTASDTPEFTLLCKFNKAIKPKTWTRINSLFFEYSIGINFVTPDSLRIDSTLVESNIHYPADSQLLWDCYRKLEQLVKRHNNVTESIKRIRLRFHMKKVKKLVFNLGYFFRGKMKDNKSKELSLYRCLIGRVEHVTKSLSIEKDIYNIGFEYWCQLSNRVIHQAKSRVIYGQQVSNSEKVLSIFEPHTQLVIRGKAGYPVEFGHKVAIAQSKEKFIVYTDVEIESIPEYEHLNSAIKETIKYHGKGPDLVAGDKGYWQGTEQYNNLQGTVKTVSIPKKGNRNTKEYNREHSKPFLLGQRFRSGIEGSIGVLKHQFKMLRALWKGLDGFQKWVQASIFTHNLVLVGRES